MALRRKGVEVCFSPDAQSTLRIPDRGRMLERRLMKKVVVFSWGLVFDSWTRGSGGETLRRSTGLLGRKELRGLQRFTEVYRGLQRSTKVYRNLQ